MEIYQSTIFVKQQILQKWYKSKKGLDKFRKSFLLTFLSYFFFPPETVIIGYFQLPSHSFSVSIYLGCSLWWASLSIIWYHLNMMHSAAELW